MSRMSGVAYTKIGGHKCLHAVLWAQTLLTLLAIIR
jgi:hypothetical protein